MYDPTKGVVFPISANASMSRIGDWRGQGIISLNHIRVEYFLMLRLKRLHL